MDKKKRPGQLALVFLAFGLLAAMAGPLMASARAAEPECKPVDCTGLDAKACVEKATKENKEQLDTALTLPEATLKRKITDAKKKDAEKALNAMLAARDEAAKAEKEAREQPTIENAQKMRERACQVQVKYNELKPFLEREPAGSTAVPPDGAPAAPQPAATPDPATAEAGVAAEWKQICTERCVSPGAFCIDVDTGKSACGSFDGAFGLPARLREGQTWIVRVIGRDGTRVEMDLKVGEIRMSDRLFGGSAGAEKGQKAAPAPPPKLIVLKEVVYLVPASTDVSAVEVLFTRKGEKSLSERHEVPVDHGKYYLEVGLLVPIVPYGTREIRSTTFPGSGGEKRLSLREDVQVTAALSLSVFPCGRRRGLWSAFQQLSKDTACDFLGFQVGFDLDFKNAFQRIYAGLVIEPIAGLGTGFGLALVQGDFLPPGYAEGMLLPRDETFTPSRQYMPRFYFGITLTTDILTSLSSASTALKSKF